MLVGSNPTQKSTKRDLKFSHMSIFTNLLGTDKNHIDGVKEKSVKMDFPKYSKRYTHNLEILHST